MNAVRTVALLAATISMGLVAGVFALHASDVPLNDALKAAGDPDHSSDLAAVRTQFNEPRWTTWNLVRTVTSTAAFALLTWALVVHGRST